MIEVQNLVKQYGSRCAVDHLSFTVEDGQVFGLLGPNGAGKSTTMNILTGYLSATEGTVRIQGHDLLEEPEAARKCVGYLPEIPPLYPDMTVREYLQFCAELKKLPKASQADDLQQALALTHLESQAGRLIQNLSKGYRQRVGLAQAILGFPPIIILDEPTVGLDPKQVVEIRALIRHLAREHTVVLSSHILSEIRAVCDHVLILRKGKVMACDSPEALEEKLSAEGGLELTVRAAPDDAKATAESVDGVSDCTAEFIGDATHLTIRVEGDVREALFYAFADAHQPILELRSKTASLEEVFLDLTDEDDAVAARAAALLTPQDAGRASAVSDAQESTEETEEDAHAGDL